MMDEEQGKLTTVLTNVLSQTLILNNKQKAAIINYVRERGKFHNTNTHICINCMKVAFELWKNQRPTKETLGFFMDILIEFSTNKTNFDLLHQNRIFKGINHVFQTTDYTKDCDIFRRYIKLLDVFTYHESGRNLLVHFWDSWKNVFKVIGTQKYTEDLSVLLTDLFLSVVDSSEFFSLNLSRLILQPLTIVCIKIAKNNLSGIVEEDLYYDIIPTLNLLSSVIMCTCEKVTLDNQWLKHCSKLLEFKKPLTLLLEIVKGNELTLELSKLLSGLYFLDIAHNSNKHQDFIKIFFDSTIKLIDLNSNRQFLDNIAILTYHWQHYWYHISRLFDVTKLELPCNYDEFMCMYQIIPMIGTCKKILGKEYMNNMREDVLRIGHFDYLLKKLGKTILVRMNDLRKLFMSKDTLIPEVHLTLDSISKSLPLHKKCCNLIIFNAMVYIMGDIISDIHKNKSIKSQFYDSSMVTHFINTFIFYGGESNVTWKDIPTHMLVLVTVTDLLQVQDLPSEVIVAALKMLDLAIAKRMAPDLSLLVDCNSLNSVGNLLRNKLNCENVEVRSAASKVLVTISESAKSNYPNFQKILLDSDIPQQLLTRIFNKEDLKVRCNAVKCLQHLVRIPLIWDAISSFLNIDSIINLLEKETETLLKADLVNLMAIIYEEDYFNDLQINELYELMTNLGMNDSDVTLRINCLKFWDVVIKKLLIEEGMIDGEFPGVTFSKESKKIVVLNEDEIQRRLKRLMRKLTVNGCLTVLNHCFTTKEKEEKQCVDEIVYDLLVILKTHDIDENNVDLSHSKSKEFLENVTQYSANYCNEDASDFVQVLDAILKDNNIVCC